jgi:hypothetical protein
VTQAEFPEDEGGVENYGGDGHSQDQTWHEAEYGVRPRKGHDGQADVFGEQQARSLGNH